MLLLLHLKQDVHVAKCLKHFGVVPYDTRDALGQERFHPFTPGHHLAYRYLSHSNLFIHTCLCYAMHAVRCIRQCRAYDSGQFTKLADIAVYCSACQELSSTGATHHILRRFDCTCTERSVLDACAVVIYATQTEYQSSMIGMLTM
jgi:hypothetical protein